ncbi:FAD binding domain-containing protein [Zopfia rhizophila CBS 207.26]|uniref:FAD binding domain-containing protein n=1 Tax=Zopfia rhizophila CBS 207.26 TaxID=1314779 RepID=A0A6A6EBH4_9PEZI|nr:FAD binding domain-containing protein [Zopfia rhizophila CBS 207.26]
MSQKHAKVLIAGGSIAGLTLANMLEQISIDYLVLEKYPQIAPDLGASIAIFPNGARILDQIGCWEKIRALLEGADAFKTMAMRNERGETVSEIIDASQHFVKRLGYEPTFIDRQMVIQVLSENIKDKSRILTSKRVLDVEPISGGVRVVTKDGDSFTGEILVGADGIHSTVRREMWRIADQAQPGYFPQKDRTDVPCDYCCIFGISKPTSAFPRYSSQNVLGQNYSYLLASGPNHRIYWFLFKKLSKRSRGLYEKIPRYTAADRDEMAEEHVDDPLTDTLRFGDLYKTRTTATLQALPEVVFSKWHYGRIITIGDAAHKFNPIGGQGGNSAIEDAAVLTNHIFDLRKSKGKASSFTDTDIAIAFESTQTKRHDRASMLMGKSHDLQSLQAMDTFVSKLIARYIIPHSSKEQVLEMISSNVRPAARLGMSNVPTRPHCDLYHDERPATPLGEPKAARLLAFGVFLYLTIVSEAKMRLPNAPLPKDFLGIPPQTHFTGIQLFDQLLNMIVLSFADSISWDDVGHNLQFFYLLSFLLPTFVLWYIEGYRFGNKWSLISWPTFYGVAMNFRGIGVVAPLYFLASIWSTSRTTYDTDVNHHIPESVAQAILPATLIGYGIPTLLIFIPYFPKAHLQNLVALWQFAAILVRFLIIGLSYVYEWRNKKVSTSQVSPDFAIYSLQDGHHLKKAYKVIFLLCLLYHLLVASYISFSRIPALSFVRLLFPGSNSPEEFPESLAAGMFTFLKWDHLFAIMAVVLYGLYSLYELRCSGLVTTKQALAAMCAYLGAQIPVGPGAAIIALWWWREKALRGREWNRLGV